MTETGQQFDPDSASDLGDAGATLLEMLVVLTIVALTLVVAVPWVGRPSTALDLRTMTQDIASRLRAARAAAIVRQDDVTVRFDLEKRTFAVSGTAKAFPLAAGLDMMVTSAREARGTQKDAAIAFFSDGSSSGGEVRLSAGGKRSSIAIDWLTGAVRIGDVP